MSLSSLPAELVRQIIESATSTLYLPEMYSERQETLCSLCLVSRRFLLLARPILYELVRIGPPRQLDLLLDTVEESAGRTTLSSLVFRDAGGLGIDWDFDRLAQLSRHTLRSLVLEIARMERLDLCFLQFFPGLSRCLLTLCVNAHSFPA